MYTSTVKTGTVKVGKNVYTREYQDQVLNESWRQLQQTLHPLKNTLNLVPMKYYYDGLTVKSQCIGPKRGYKYVISLEYNPGKDLYILTTHVIDTKYRIEKRTTNEVYYDSIHDIVEYHLYQITNNIPQDERCID